MTIVFRVIWLLLIFSAAASAAIQRPLTTIRQWEGIDPRFHTTADIDGDGNRELIVRSHSGRDVHVLRGDGSARGYTVLGRIEGASFDRVIWHKAVDTNDDGRPELVIAWTGGRIVVVDGVSLQVRAETRITAFVTGVAVGDVDGDGASEMLARRGGSLMVLSPGSLQTLGSLPFPIANSSSAFEIADVYGDARAEVVVADGVAYSISRSGQSYSATPVWTSLNGSMWYFGLADIDADGKFEAVSARYDGRIGIERISPAPSYTPLVQYDIAYGLALEDLTGDGLPEALVSRGSVDDLVALTLKGVELWRMDQLHLNGVSVLRRATGELSLVFGHDWGLHVRPLPDARGKSWGIGPGSAYAVQGSAFYEDDGQTRTAILAATAPLGNPLAAVELWDGFLRDAGGSGTAWTPAPPTPQQIGATRVVAIDRPDRSQEVLALVGRYCADPVNGAPVEPRVWIMDRNAALVRQRTVVANLTPLDAVRWHSVGEGQPQIAISGRQNASSGRLLTIGLDDGAVVWQSELLALEDGLPLPLQAEDLDGDGNQELIAQVGSNVLVFAPAAGTSPVRVHANVTAASVLPALAPTPAQLFLARADGSVSVHQGLAATPSAQIALWYASYSIAAFRDPESGEPLLAATDGTSGLHVHQVVDGEHVASAPSSGRRLVVRDIDGDRRAEIVATDYGHQVLRLGSAERIHDSGFE